MSFSVTFFVNGGLFDFDLTFAGEGLLFLLFSLFVSFSFLSPVSKILDKREDFINYSLRKATVLIGIGYKDLSESVELLTMEVSELNRQIKLIKVYTSTNFEKEVNLVQEENSKLISKLKGELAIQSASLFSNITNELTTITDNFFNKRFQSIS